MPARGRALFTDEEDTFMPEGRRRYGVLSLLLVLCLVATALVGTADARPQRHGKAQAHARHYTKAQKRAIRKQLMRAVKRSHGRAVTKRWFLKKASIVSFTLPATIRLDAVTDQNGT